MNEKRLVSFGERIRQLRKEKGLSQEAFAVVANIDRSYMGHIERGTKNVTLSKIHQLADALEITLKDLFSYDK